MARRVIFAFVISIIFIYPIKIFAEPFSKIVVFGDSLVDNTGNLSSEAVSLLGFPFPPSPYSQGRSSNGDLSTDYLGRNLGLSVESYAVFGAFSGAGNILDNVLLPPPTLPGEGFSGMNRQLSTFASMGPVDADALYMIWVGPNDLFAFPSDPVLAVTSAVANIANAVGSLAGLGAKHFLIPNMPDLGLTPFIRGLDNQVPGLSSQFTALSIAFNDGLSGTLGGLPFDITEVDVFGIMREIVNNPSTLGFTNVTDSCLGPLPPGLPILLDPSTANVCANPDEYLFWDGIHPTTRVHEALGQRFQAAIVPEPMIITLFGLGLVAMLTIVRRRRNRTG